MRYWLRSADKQSLGPFTPEQIRKIRGVTDATMVYPETGQTAGDWKHVRDVPELLATLRKPSPPPLPQVHPSPSAVPSTGSAMSQVQSIGPTEQNSSRLAIVALGLTTLSIPWSIIVYESPRLWRLTGVVRWYSPVLLILLPILFCLVSAAISWSRAMKAVSRSGGGASTAALVIGSMHLLIASLLSIMLYKASHRAATTATKPTTQKIEQPAITAADPWAGRDLEAIVLARNFPIRKFVFPRCPRKIETAADVVADDGAPKNFANVLTWPRTRTIDDVIQCDRLIPAAMWMSVTAMQEKKEGVFISAESWRQQIRAAADRGDERLRAMVITVSEKWEAEHESGPRYKVRVTLHETGRKLMGPIDKTKTWEWQVDLAAKSMKPLNLGAWTSLDISAAGAWTGKEVRRDPKGQIATQSATDMVDVSAVAPIYQTAVPSKNGSEMEGGSP